MAAAALRWGGRSAGRRRRGISLLLRRRSGETTGSGSPGRRFRMTEEKGAAGGSGEPQRGRQFQKGISSVHPGDGAPGTGCRDNSPATLRRFACRIPGVGARSGKHKGQTPAGLSLSGFILPSRLFLSSFLDMNEPHQRPMSGCGDPVLLAQTHHGAVDEIDLGAPSVLQILTHGCSPGG